VIFFRANGGTLCIADSALASIDAFRQHDQNSAEAGGVLLGRLVIERPDIVVESVTVPSAADRRSRRTFFRAQLPTQAAINSAWAASGATQNYLGEWHTHPEDHPTPSAIDRRGWQRLLRKAQFEQDALFFVIVGRGSIGVWEGLRGGGPAVQLRPVATTESEEHHAR
jgi:integrative and conjugative element protein (TIGR02256 family)